MRVLLLLLAVGLVATMAPAAEAHEVACSLAAVDEPTLGCVVECAAHVLELTGDSCRLQS